MVPCRAALAANALPQQALHTKPPVRKNNRLEKGAYSSPQN